MTGYEALARWKHPNGTVLGPDAFIPLAEELGLMPQVDRTRATTRGGGCASLATGPNTRAAYFRKRFGRAPYGAGIVL